MIVTFNVRRCFDANCDSGQSLAAAILAFDADIVILQEVENQNCIDALTVHLGDQLPRRVSQARWASAAAAAGRTWPCATNQSTARCRVSASGRTEKPSSSLALPWS